MQNKTEVRRGMNNEKQIKNFIFKNEWKTC